MSIQHSLLTHSSQTADIAAWYNNVMALRQMAFAQATPIMAPARLLSSDTSSEQDYSLPIAPLALGRTVQFKDGDRPGARKPQGYKISGTCLKRGVEPLRFSEGDRLANRVNFVASNTMARGRAEKLLPDSQATAAIENGTSATLQKSFDERAFFATNHYQDAAAKTGSQSNLLTLALTPDNIAQAIITMKKWKAENGDPIFMGFNPEIVLMAPPALEFVAKKALREYVGEGGAAVSNVVQNATSSTVINPFLTSDTAWYLFIVNAGLSPVVRVVHRDYERWDRGPDSALFEKNKEVEIFADEWTDYRMTDWRIGLKSVPA